MPTMESPALGRTRSPSPPEGLPWPGRCLEMGILNVTPDSFSDGGVYADTRHAIDRGLELAAQGADIVDVGGESTRPGARPVCLDEELARTVPVIRELARAGVCEHRHHARARGPRRGRGGGGPRQRRQWRLGRPGYGAGRRRGRRSVCRHALAWTQSRDGPPCRLRRRRGRRHGRTRCLPLAVGGGGGRSGPHRPRPGARLRQASRARLGSPGRAGEAADAGLSPAGRPIEEAVHRGGPRGGGAGEVPPAGRDAATAAVSALAAVGGAFCVRVHDVRASLDAVHMAAAYVEHVDRT